jgi:hypothetical protein
MLGTAASGSPAVYFLCDYLGYYPLIDGDNTDEQLLVNYGASLSPTTDPSVPTLPRYTDGIGVKAFYVTTDEELARSNYADFTGDEEGGVVLEFEMNPIDRFLDLRKSDDWDTYSNLKYKGREIRSFMGIDEFPLIMKSLGIDALYDRSNDAFAIYNIKTLELI